MVTTTRMDLMECKNCAKHLGHTYDELELILGDRLEEFYEWMRGQTCAWCEQHGEITYRWDLDRFLKRLPVID